MGVVERIKSLGRKGRVISGTSVEDRDRDPFKKLKEKTGVTVYSWARRSAKKT